MKIEKKKKIKEDWEKAFPELNVYSQNKFYKVLDPIIIGLELIKLPHSDEYRPHFVAYSLFEKDIKSCLNYPFILKEFRNKKRLQFDIPYDSHELLFKDCLDVIINQSPLEFDKDVILEKLFLEMDNYSLSAPMISSKDSYLYALFLETKLNIAIYVDEIKAHLVWKEISSIDWDRNHFKMFDVNFIDWFSNLEHKFNDREKIIQQVKINLSDKKISKLNYSKIVKE